MHYDDDEDTFEYSGPSKSQRKREAEALRELGARLTTLPQAQLARVPMPEPLAAAVHEARRITSHGARRRQLQLIGKLMRQLDPEPIQAALEQIDAGNAAGRREQHVLEAWVERLTTAGGDAALTELIEAHAELDRQHLRQLVRSAQRELDAERAPRSRRELFRYLRDQGIGRGEA